MLSLAGTSQEFFFFNVLQQEAVSTGVSREMDLSFMV